MSSLVYVPREINFSPLVLIGEAPGATEEIQGRPFVGQSGKLLRQLFTDALEEVQPGFTTFDITNCVKIRPPDNRKPTTQECDSWFPILQQEIHHYYYVVTVGATAQDVLHRHRNQLPEHHTYFHIYHPAYILRNRSKLEEYKISIRQVVEAIHPQRIIHPELTLPATPEVFRA